MKTKTAIKRAWMIGNVFLAAVDEQEARRIYRRELEPNARNLAVIPFEGPYTICQDEDEPEFETDEQGFVNMLEGHGGYWCR